MNDYFMAQNSHINNQEDDNQDNRYSETQGDAPFIAEDIPPPTDADAPPPPDETAQHSMIDYDDAIYRPLDDCLDMPDPLDYEVLPCSAPAPRAAKNNGDIPLQHPVGEGVLPSPQSQPQATPPTPTDADAPPPKWVVKRPNGTDVCGTTFVEAFAPAHKVRCVGGQFYLGDKLTSDEAVKKIIYEQIIPYAKVSANKITAIASLLGIKTVTAFADIQPNRADFTNCSLTLEGDTAQGGKVTLRMHPPKDVSSCRIPHVFHPKAGEPTQFLAFLNQLLHPDDIPTLQQYLGYCLFPSTKAQKALFIIGKGGEGKSRLTMLMQQVLGDACAISSLSRIGERFFGQTLENRLLFIDDDLYCDKFHATDSFKTLVTNETPIAIEPKGKPLYHVRIYARFLLMGNQSMGSLHDRSEGFYRRVHIINTKPRDTTRTHNPHLMEEIWQAEQAEILLWLVKGALQLARQSYQLTESAASRAAVTELKQTDNSSLAFLQEQSFAYGEDCSVTSAMLTARYREWCMDNDMFKVGGQAFKQTCEAFFEGKGVKYTRGVKTATGYVRGFEGVRCLA